MSRKERERIKIMAGIEQQELTVVATAVIVNLRLAVESHASKWPPTEECSHPRS